MTAKTLFLSTLAGASVLASAAFAGDVTVTLTGVQARGGTMLVALQSREQFMQHAGTAGTMQANPAAGVLTVTLRNVPAGDYALTALHDADGNRQMRLDAQGRPAEGWAMSRVGADLNHRPTFDEVRVHVPAEGAAITAPVVYPAG